MFIIKYLYVRVLRCCILHQSTDQHDATQCFYLSVSPNNDAHLLLGHPTADAVNLPCINTLLLS